MIDDCRTPSHHDPTPTTPTISHKLQPIYFRPLSCTLPNTLPPTLLPPRHRFIFDCPKGPGPYLPVFITYDTYSIRAPSQLEPFISAPSSCYPILPGDPPPHPNRDLPWTMATLKRPSCKSHLGSHIKGVHTSLSLRLRG